MSLALELAQRVRALTYDDLPPEAVQWARVGILDTVGVTLAGSNDDSTRIVNTVIGGGHASGPAVIFGRAKRASPLDVALINGTAAHALDFDDCNNTLGGHPSAPILPALFALADDIGASGRDFVAAYIAGFEVETKLSLGVNFYHYTKGWHPTATLGVFGATAACSKLLKLSDEQTAIAFGLTTSFASGVKANFGTMTKPLHVGHCARNGLFAALLAKEGFSANPASFEHKQGFLNVFNGPANYYIDKILPRWAAPLDIVEPGIAIKQYPCCGSTHPAADAMLELVHKHKLRPDRIVSMESLTHPRRLEHTNRPDPKTSVDAKFSVQYVLARAVTDGAILVEHFEGDAFRDPKVRALMTKVRAAPYTSEHFPEDNHFGAQVTVKTTEGQTLVARVDQPHGRTSANPLSAEALKIKFDNCARRVLPEAGVGHLYESIQDIEKLKDVRAVTAIIAGDIDQSKHQAAA
jgi:2-methylcitrate dehydratase PrpD